MRLHVYLGLLTACGTATAAACDGGSSRGRSQVDTGVEAGASLDAGKLANDAEVPERQDGGEAGTPRQDAGTEQDGSVPPPLPKHTFVYVGGWDWSSASTYPFGAYELDRDTGALTLIDTYNLGPNPSMIANAQGGKLLVVGNEVGSSAGGITTASVDLVTGTISKIDHESADGADVVFTATSPDQRFVLAASYGTGRLFVFPLGEDGALAPYVDSESFGGSAQTHSIRVHPSGRWAYAPNKALGNVSQLSYSAKDGQLTVREAGAFDPTDIAQPRHLAFDATGTFAFVSSESDSRLASLRIGADGALNAADAQSTLPQGFAGMNTGAHVLARGGHVYASNRGHNSIAVFDVSGSGTLRLLEHEATRGQTPRHFDIDDRGEWLIVANQDSGSLAAFRISADGMLSPAGTPVTGLKKPNAVAIVNAL